MKVVPAGDWAGLRHRFIDIAGTLPTRLANNFIKPRAEAF
jgi:hypothetical protein